MKFKLYISSAVVLLFSIIAIVSCDKEVNYTESLPALTPSSEDETAGNWTMLLMTSPTQVALAKPYDDTMKLYLAEIAAVKKLQGELNNSQRKAIAYWSGGGVVRWNQIFRELVARYNLPPEPLPNGTYPIPDSENPFGFPQFPFSNPPYAARAYAYVSAAQYDALKAAWYYKYQTYSARKTPYQFDSSIKALLPTSTLPGYPNEEAVMSGAAAEMLKVLFPAAVEEITLKAAEQRNVALWSGKATASEIKNSLDLGKNIAALFITRAKGDKMGAAVGNQAGWDTLGNATVKRGDVAWHSLETPRRPPMLPYFRNVTPWIMKTVDIVSVRPGPPPVAGDDEMNVEVKEVKWYSDHLTRDRIAIVHKWADGVSTYTPPGHWNDIAEEYIVDAKYSEVRAARAFALLNITEENAAIACWDTKFYYYNARPSQLDPSIKTGTGVPNFPSYVSGHSTFSAAAAAVLSYLFPQDAAQFDAWANEAAASRLYGGIHYKSDCDAGMKLGSDVSTYTLNFAASDGAN
ncbi:MAG TPA: phosphatase PAP2 family protein [Cyclobacteriaceae bacterium]